jgi:hypothetical protein
MFRKVQQQAEILVEVEIYVENGRKWMCLGSLSFPNSLVFQYG